MSASHRQTILSIYVFSDDGRKQSEGPQERLTKFEEGLELSRVRLRSTTLPSKWEANKNEVSRKTSVPGTLCHSTEITTVFFLRVTLICSFSLVKRICLVPFKSDVTFKRKLEMNSHMLYVSDSYKTNDTDFLLCKKWKINLSLYHLMLMFRIFSNHSIFKFISVI